MRRLYQEVTEKFNEFLVKISYGIEGFKYNGKTIGSSVLLINFIQTKPHCSMSDIKDFLKVTPSTATRRVDKLVDLGLAERTIGKSDHRSILISLSDEGKELFSFYQNKRFQGLKELSQKFDKDQIKTFLTVLDFFIKASDEFITN